jgi:hypothetical protein
MEFSSTHPVDLLCGLVKATPGHPVLWLCSCLSCTFFFFFYYYLLLSPYFTFFYLLLRLLSSSTVGLQSLFVIVWGSRLVT